ncbi:hypothetical protein Angca_008204, partial [Angiostrongylus cantonensis]
RIPYATPPIRDLRFEKPRPPQKWAGIRDATEYGPACMSNSSMTTSPQKWIDEDCLHVNIFAGVDCLEKACPVVFYIHGGGFNYDSAVMFNDEFLINNFGGNGSFYLHTGDKTGSSLSIVLLEDVVLVIPGVRLGFFGLLNFDDEDVVPANIAAYDLIAALQFVQKDIKPFGGNPDDVTLFGHSQGATTVAQFLFSKEIDPSRKYRRIAQRLHATWPSILGSISDVGWRSLQPYATIISYSNLPHWKSCKKKQSKSSTEGVVNCLRQVDAFELLRIQREMEDDDRRRRPGGLAMSSPLFKGSNLQSFLRNPLPRPVLAGTTSREFDDERNGDWLSCITDFLGIKNQDEILKQYRKDNLSGKIQGNLKDQLFINLGINNRLKDNVQVYLYSYRNPRRPYHVDDLSYIMGIHPFEYDENDKVLAVVYPQFFIDFIKTAKPREDWTPLQAELDNYMYIDVDVKNHSMPHMENYYEHDVIDYWKSLVELDKILSGKNQTVAAQRAVNTSVTSTSILDLLLAALPVAAVAMVILMTACTVRQRNQQRR